MTTPRALAEHLLLSVIPMAAEGMEAEAGREAVLVAMTQAVTRYEIEKNKALAASFSGGLRGTIDK